MVKQYNVAVVGATGAVGEAMLSILTERKFPVKNIFALASERSTDKTVTFGNHETPVGNLAEFDFTQADIALFAAGGTVSAEYAPKAAAAGCLVIDNTSKFRYEKDVPLVITEVNPHALSEYKNRNIIANPNCSTIQMLVALKPIYDAVGIHRINVSTYQSVSGAGRSAVNELVEQTTRLLNGLTIKPNIFPRQIAFNLIPQIDVFQENGYTFEEMKMVWETQKILEDASIQVNPTAVRVPVFYGHSEAINIETKKKITAKQAQQLLRKAPGVVVMDQHKDGGYPTPFKEATGTDDVYVGRIREDISHPQGLNMWVVSDNIRKGAALNAVQIAELMIEKYL